MDKINIFSVAKQFLSLVTQNFECDDTTPTEEETQIAEVLLDKFEDFLYEYTFVEEEENVEDGPDAQTVCAYVDDEGAERDEVALDYKIRAVDAYYKNSKWRFSTFRQKFSKAKYQYYIYRWKKQIAMGGTKFEIYKNLEAYVLERFREAREDFRAVHSMDIRRWALIKAHEYPGFKFKGSDRWIACFKKRNGISSRKIQKLIKRSVIPDLDKIQVVAENFRNDIKALLPTYVPNCVWNTDQTGFKYEIVSNRTLTWKGERTTFRSAISPKNKVTHSYTVQYVITYGGTIIPKLFICLQEPDGSFGPNVVQNLFTAPNLFVVASKSGKLGIPLVEEFLDNIIQPNLTDSTLYILDNWTAQTNMELYNSRFMAIDNDEDSTVTVKFVPENCTDIAQPLDTYFHRELKYLVKMFYYYDALHNTEESSELCSRNGILKLQSLVHFLLSAPTFKDMIRYCWYSSGLWSTDEKPIFQNIKNVCFQFGDSLCNAVSCSNSTFIKCSWCSETFCFIHFYESSHLFLCPFNPF